MAASGKIGRTERLQLDGVSRREPVTLRRDEHSARRSMALGARRGAGAALGPSLVGARARRWSSCGTWAEAEGAELGSERRGGARPELEGDGGVELGRERLERSSTGTPDPQQHGRGGARGLRDGGAADWSGGPPRRRRGGGPWRRRANRSGAEDGWAVGGGR